MIMHLKISLSCAILVELTSAAPICKQSEPKEDQSPSMWVGRDEHEGETRHYSQPNLLISGDILGDRDYTSQTCAY